MWQAHRVGWAETVREGKPIVRRVLLCFELAVSGVV